MLLVNSPACAARASLPVGMTHLGCIRLKPWHAANAATLQLNGLPTALATTAVLSSSPFNCAVGEVLVDAAGVSVTCKGSTASSPGSAPAPSNSSSGSSHSSSGGTPGWVWAIVAVAVVAGIGGAVAGVLIWRRRRAAATVAACAPAAGSGLESRSSSAEIDKKISSGTVEIAVFTPRG